MTKTVKIFALYLFIFTAISAQTLCPPAFLTASPSNGEANLSWSAPDTAFYGDILLAECFADCDVPIPLIPWSIQLDKRHNINPC
jgi:hypothetical protein